MENKMQLGVKEVACRPYHIESQNLISEGVPEGYATVFGWWAENEQSALELLDRPLRTMFADSEALQTMSEKRGSPFYWVKAPNAAAEFGMTEVQAFPVRLLAEYYPLNP